MVRVRYQMYARSGTQMYQAQRVAQQGVLQESLENIRLHVRERGEPIHPFKSQAPNPAISSSSIITSNEKVLSK